MAATNTPNGKQNIKQNVIQFVSQLVVSSAWETVVASPPPPTAPVGGELIAKFGFDLRDRGTK